MPLPPLTRPAALVLAVLVLSTLGVVPELAWQATDCGTADSLAMPVDTARYALVQDYTVPSPRHQGRYHTGEDWALPAGEALGEPVRAIGTGKVWVSSPNGWGRDGGVVVVEHRLSNGATVYSLYGHLMPTDSAPFLRVGDCVAQGDIVGAIADVRPAPHVHFEVRLALPYDSGAGYTWELPEAHPIQYRRPSEVVRAYAAPP
jgi:murein DD-endopeptidase MepM/ murein hydrolase activator NlpD